MCAVPLKGLHKDDVSLEQLQALQKLIKKRIPVGAPGCRIARSVFNALDSVGSWACAHVPFVIIIHAQRQEAHAVRACPKLLD